jgi:hypothetical protein
MSRGRDQPGYVPDLPAVAAIAMPTLAQVIKFRRVPFCCIIHQMSQRCCRARMRTRASRAFHHVARLGRIRSVAFGQPPPSWPSRDSSIARSHALAASCFALRPPRDGTQVLKTTIEPEKLGRDVMSVPDTFRRPRSMTGRSTNLPAELAIDSDQTPDPNSTEQAWSTGVSGGPVGHDAENNRRCRPSCEASGAETSSSQCTYHSH